MATTPDLAELSPESQKQPEFQKKLESQKEKAGIRRAFSRSMIAEVEDQLQSAPILKSYEAIDKDAPIPWEAIEVDDSTALVLVNAWIENRENIKHVARHLNRRPPENDGDPLQSWAAIRIKKLSQPGILTHPFSKHGNCVVFIAVEPWNKTNGFFIENLEVEPGEYIALPNSPGLRFPGTGGAMLIMLMLTLEK